jgi:hypothetical protein
LPYGCLIGELNSDRGFSFAVCGLSSRVIVGHFSGLNLVICLESLTDIAITVGAGNDFATLPGAG